MFAVSNATIKRFQTAIDALASIEMMVPARAVGYSDPVDYRCDENDTTRKAEALAETKAKGLAELNKF